GILSVEAAARPEERVRRVGAEEETSAALSVFLGLAETVRFTLFAFFIRAVAKSLADNRSVSSALALAITFPCVSVPLIVASFMIRLSTSRQSASAGLGPLLIFLQLFALAGLMVWYAATVRRAGDAVEKSRKTRL